MANSPAPPPRRDGRRQPVRGVPGVPQALPPAGHRAAVPAHHGLLHSERGARRARGRLHRRADPGGRERLRALQEWGGPLRHGARHVPRQARRVLVRGRGEPLRQKVPADHHRQRGGAAVHPQVHGPGPLIAVFRFLRPPSLPSTPAVSIAGRRIHGQLLRPEASGGIPTPPHPRSFDVSPSLARPARALKGGRWASCSGGGGHRREDRGFDSTSFAESQ
mmetsp:Transcript_86378/g.230731  ORF Transcript_86378/g.230731 Transcript_86378/m.230731 type:complete len:220 (-) Transcript_86378:138-797(-)